MVDWKKIRKTLGIETKNKAIYVTYFILSGVLILTGFWLFSELVQIITHTDSLTAVMVGALFLVVVFIGFSLWVQNVGIQYLIHDLQNRIDKMNGGQ